MIIISKRIDMGHHYNCVVTFSTFQVNNTKHGITKLLF